MRKESDVMKMSRTLLHWLLTGDTVCVVLMETGKITAARSVERRLTGLYAVHRPGQVAFGGRGVMVRQGVSIQG